MIGVDEINDNLKKIVYFSPIPVYSGLVIYPPLVYLTDYSL
jgi:hypothetical protein